MAPVSETEVDVGEGGSAGGLSQADCTCPVCLEIFLEPVTLPCSHTFCKPCFLETVDKANLCCPLCRRRVSTWARLHSRNKTLVNVELWRRLQEAFPAQCQRRLSGQDAEDMATVACRPRVSLPGEVRREYEDQITKLAEEKRALEEAERRASEEYIQRLLAEEEERRAEERRALEERQLEEDERLARLLSQELNSTPMSESQRNARPAESTSTKKKSSAGDIERFLLPLPLRSPTSAETSPGSSLTANKENILMLPSSVVTEEMPTLDFYGKESSARSQPEGAEPLPPDACCAQLEQDADGRGSSVSQTRGGASGKRKSGDADAGRGCGLDSKRPRGPASGPAEAPLAWELAREEEDLFSRRQQEESDRQLALRLQKQLDREEAQRAVDRSKGSPDQYPLRDKPEPGTAPGPAPGPAPSAATDASPAVRASRGRSSAAVTPKEQKNRARRQLAGAPKERQATRKDTSASTSDSAPSSTTSALQKGGKQTTLTAMFPSLAS